MNNDRLAEIVALVRRIRHDANNPITAALGHVQLLIEDDSIQDPAARSSLQVVDSELRRLVDIMRGLNDIRVEP
jgi:signal transduction histidine kinase